MRLAIFILAAFSAFAQSLSKDVQPVFKKYCYDCHSAAVKMGSLDLETYEGIQRGGNHGTIVVPGKSDESRLYLTVAGKIKPMMPMDGRKLADGELEVIKRWIDAGAINDLTNTAATPASKQPIPVVKPKTTPSPRIFALSWSPDGKLLAAGGYKEVRLYDNAAKQIATLEGHAESVRAVAISKDGTLLAAAGGLPGQKGEVKLWNLATRQVAATINGHDDCIYAVAISPDGKTIATASYDKVILLWDAATGKQLRPLKDHIDAIYALVFTPDGAHLLSAAADRTIKIWNPKTGERLYTLSEPTDGVNAIALSPDGKQVAAAGIDKTIRVWTLGDKSGELVNSLIAHEDAILQIVWSPDGKLLASSSADRTIKYFQMPGLVEAKSIPNQSDWPSALAFTPDGRRLAAGRLDGSLQFYDAAQAPQVLRAQQ